MILYIQPLGHCEQILRLSDPMRIALEDLETMLEPCRSWRVPLAWYDREEHALLERSVSIACCGAIDQDHLIVFPADILQPKGSHSRGKKETTIDKGEEYADSSRLQRNQPDGKYRSKPGGELRLAHESDACAHE